MSDGLDGRLHDLGRRDFLRRGATVGVAAVWAVPVLISLPGTAVAATGSEVDVGGTKKGNDGTDVAGDKLPRTGADGHLLDTALVGVGLTVAGAATIAVAKGRRTRAAESGSGQPPEPSAS